MAVQSSPDPVIPQEWRDCGYSGAHMFMVRLTNGDTNQPAEPDRVAVQAAKVPYEIAQGWLALAVETLDGYPQMILVRKDVGVIATEIRAEGVPS